MSDFTDLSKREHQSAGLVAYGYSNNAIAEILNIQPGTVKNHMSAIYKKLGFKQDRMTCPRVKLAMEVTRQPAYVRESRDG